MPPPLPPKSFAGIGRRITAWTSNLLASSVVLLLALGVGRQLVQWYRVESPPESPAAGVGAPLPELGTGESVELNFGDSPFTFERRVVQGDAAAAGKALVAACRETLAPAPLGPPGPAEIKLLELCDQAAPVEALADGRRIFAPRSEIPLAVVVQQLGKQPAEWHGLELADTKVAGDENRVVTWGMAAPAGPDEWHIYAVHAEPGSAAIAPTDDLALPPRARRLLTLRDRRGGSLRSFTGNGASADWIAFIGAWFGQRHWSRSADWRLEGGYWHARYELKQNSERVIVDLQIGPEGAAEQNGLAITQRESSAESAATNP